MRLATAASAPRSLLDSSILTLLAALMAARGISAGETNALLARSVELARAAERAHHASEGGAGSCVASRATSRRPSVPSAIAARAAM